MSTTLADELSGGVRERVALAHALALGRELLVCDGTISGLEVPVGRQPESA
jgi:ABC-type dipeptide/oligopeptide/nickel transport system ATPase subunit